MGKEIFACLAELQFFHSTLTSMNWDTCLSHVEKSLDMIKTDDLDSFDEVDVFVPLWQESPYLLAVLFESLARVTALSVVMLWDTFKAAVSSLLHKEQCV